MADKAVRGLTENQASNKISLPLLPFVMLLEYHLPKDASLHVPILLPVRGTPGKLFQLSVPQSPNV